MTDGSPYRLMLHFAIPMLIGNLFQQAYNLADSMIVGQFLGADALAAVGSTGSISFLFFSFCNGISGGGGVVTAHAFGSGNADQVRKSIANSAWIMFSLAVLTGLVSFCLTPTVLQWMGTPDSIRPDAIVYMRMTCASVPLVGIYNYASSMLRALGDSRTPLYFLVVSCLLNIILDLLFVCNFGLGVFGAAFATMLAQFIAGVGCMIYALKTNEYFRMDRAQRRPDPAMLKKIFKLGFPMAMQWSMIAVSTTGLQTFVNSFGTTAMAAYTATCRIEQLVQQPFGSLSTALATYAGQNYGAGRYDRLKDGLKANVIMTLIVSLFMTLLVQVFSHGIMGAFVSEPDVILTGATALQITSWFYLALGMIYSARGILNGIGDILFAFINGLIEIVGRLLFPGILILVPGLGLWAIWWTSGLTWLLSGIFCMGRYLMWRNRNMPKQASSGDGHLS